VTPTDDEELRVLRKRAYGRDSDIHLDPDSLRRLRELESPDVDIEFDAVDDEFDAVNERVEIIAPPPDTDPEPHEEARPTPRWFVWLLGLRRGTVLIVVGVFALAATLATALVLIERVQTDPLQVGASQVARLGADGSYEVPELFLGAGSDTSTRAYEQFLGLRFVTGGAALWFGSAPGSTCLTIYSASATSTATSFDGPLFGGCAAGDFPPIVQLSVDVEGLPAEIRSAFPEATGLQFVYDSEHDEVVVFSDH